MFHDLQAIARLGQSAAAPAATATTSWPQFSGNLADYPEFVKQWKSARQKCGVQLEEDQLCDIFQEKCMPPALQRRLAYFLTMGQVWDFLDVAVDKPRQAIAACVVMIEKLKPVKSDSSECLRKRYEELRTIGGQAKMEGVYSYLLTKAVAEKILSRLPPTEKEAMRAKSSKPAAGPPVDSLQSPEMLWEYVWQWQPPQPPPACPGVAKAAASVKKGAKKCLVEGCKGAPHQLVECEKFLDVGPINQVSALPDEAVVHCLPRRGPRVVHLDRCGATSLPGGRSWLRRMCQVRFLASQDGGLPRPGQPSGGGEGPVGHLSVCRRPIPTEAGADAGPASGDVRGGGPHRLLGLRLAGHMLTHRKAAAAGLMPEAADPLVVKGFRSDGVLLEMGYHVPLKTKDGDMHTLFA